MENKKLNDDFKRLNFAVDEFAIEMKLKLWKKMMDGWNGWDESKYTDNIKTKLFQHVDKLRTGGPQEIDIANLAMMLYHIRKNSTI